MEVLLSEDIPGLGDMGERVRVKGGYARNFLIPRGIAVEAGGNNASVLDHKKRGIESKKRKMRVAAEATSSSLSKVKITLGLRVASGGKVFGSIRRKDIADALTEQGFEIDRRRILLDEPIRTIGSHAVKVKLHADVTAPINVEVEKLEASKEEEELETISAKARASAAAAAREEEESEVLAEME